MTLGFKPVIDQIGDLNWRALSEAQLSGVAWAYYYFSVQFRESLECTFQMYPHDAQLQSLVREECATNNLSPWPDIAESGEKMDHDEFMRRILRLSPISPVTQSVIVEAGERYLRITRASDDQTKAMSIASYEGGGLELVFKAMLQAPEWGTPLLKGFQHFLIKHIDFDSDPDQGHGALVKHLKPDDRIRMMWVAFRDLLLTAVPRLAM